MLEIVVVVIVVVWCLVCVFGVALVCVSFCINAFSFIRVRMLPYI